MSRSYEEIRDEVMALPVEERGALAEEIQTSLLTDDEREIEKEWVAVAERRLAEIDAGTAKLIPAEDVIRDLKAKYAARPHRSR